jgi:hypothetical protein
MAKRYAQCMESGNDWHGQSGNEVIRYDIPALEVEIERPGYNNRGMVQSQQPTVPGPYSEDTSDRYEPSSRAACIANVALLVMVSRGKF